MYRKYDTSLSTQCRLRHAGWESSRVLRHEGLNLQREIETPDYPFFKNVQALALHINPILQTLMTPKYSLAIAALGELLWQAKENITHEALLDNYLVENGVLKQFLLMMQQSTLNENEVLTLLKYLTSVTGSYEIDSHFLFNLGIENALLPYITNPKCTDKVIWVIANLAGSSGPQRTETFMKFGPVVLQMIQNGVFPINGNYEVVWLISNFCMFDNPIPFTSLQPFLEYLFAVANKTTSHKILVEALSGIYNACESAKLWEALGSSALQVMSEYMKSEVCDVLEGVMRIAGVLACHDAFTPQLVTIGVLDTIMSLMEQTESKSAMKNAMWTLSNIVASPNSDVHYEVMKSCILMGVIRIINEENMKVGFEAAWALVNAFNTFDSSYIEHILSYNSQHVQPRLALFNMFSIKHKDRGETDHYLYYLLEAISNVLTCDPIDGQHITDILKENGVIEEIYKITTVGCKANIDKANEVLQQYKLVLEQDMDEL
ncbi:importin subunit alpha-2, putative [Entamoeba invadens IP1]|uniref:Importin subunit alpha-2, putative n=1 Tax=Entamoeba invadens IP1 TaxID=370355 RepID=A0A0A1TYR4_ENTIV|nr:importin subunit alpha-2, putative [Entamoeba invadens IP1]ELP84710.1 importin subunit alpha-2, putative [Entamoeba invadens IP1]|eukprot:XP_004184056.1 importin subunit alpha-2, putative [Entamoeba invadens IP1]